MADNRLLMRYEDREIVIAVRHGDEWRSALEDCNDIGAFLNDINRESSFESYLELEYEHEKEFCDPELPRIY